ncbi:MAG: SDH family Clp fold serine proteinase, partial [Desulfocucumaceae bacterium]
SRREAKENIGLPVFYPDPELEKTIWLLYEDFAGEFQLAEPFDPREFSSGHRYEFDISAGVVESLYSRDYFTYSGVVESKVYNGETQVNVDILKQAWKNME